MACAKESHVQIKESKRVVKLRRIKMEWITPQLLFSMCLASFLLGVIAMLLVEGWWFKRGKKL